MLSVCCLVLPPLAGLAEQCSIEDELVPLGLVFLQDSDVDYRENNIKKKKDKLSSYVFMKTH